MLDAVAAELEEYWPMERELLAIIAEGIRDLQIMFYKAFGGKGGTMNRLEVPRPGQPRAEAEALTMSEYVKEISAMREARRRRRG